MLEIVITPPELYDESKDEFVYIQPRTLQLEHSLVSISKWESKWCKPFLAKEEKSFEESIDYVRCMTITKNIDNDIYKHISHPVMQQITKYIESPMTATICHKQNKSPNREIITSEIIYYWMVALTIPFECEKWHLNRLLTLINVTNIKQTPPKKMGKKELMSRNSALNAARKNSMGTKG